jgi:hydroxymethylpyrimidine/phosphomethylpyrimidine kinase
MTSRGLASIAMVDDVVRIRCALSIAGSDSGGGAGIQADLKAFAACGVHGMTAVTAITAQNTVGVDAIESVSPRMIISQIHAIARDIAVDAVKIGMLGTVEAIDAVARGLDVFGTSMPPIVIDPVMVSESGSPLLHDDARAVLVRELLPRATVLTPNLPEARALVGAPVGPSGAEGEAGILARAIHALGPRYVVVTGGHRERATDTFFDGEQLVEIPGERHPDGASHGSGCTHSSVLAARLALGDRPLQAAREAKRRAAGAVRDGLTDVGAGPGPVDVLGIARAGARSATADDRQIAPSGLRA